MTRKKQGEILKPRGDDTRWRALLENVRMLIQQGRQRALRAVDTIEVGTCWEIGGILLNLSKGAQCTLNTAKAWCDTSPRL